MRDLISSNFLNAKGKSKAWSNSVRNLLYFIQYFKSERILKKKTIHCCELSWKITGDSERIYNNQFSKETNRGVIATHYLINHDLEITGRWIYFCKITKRPRQFAPFLLLVRSNRVLNYNLYQGNWKTDAFKTSLILQFHIHLKRFLFFTIYFDRVAIK